MTVELSNKDLLNLTESEARRIIAAGEETNLWALLKLSAMAKAAASSETDPSTPSAMVAPYKKTNAGKSRKAKKPGRKAGHKGERRPEPERIDRREEHLLKRCPDCGGPVSPTKAAPRRRVIEDIEATRVVATEHTIHSHYCPRCHKRVEPKVTQALPKATIGNRTVALTSWLHYGLGNTTSQVAQVLNSLFHFPISPGGLTQMWARAAEILEPWYTQIAAEANAGAVLHADETGWRVNGKTHWLWCFTNPRLSYYHIDPSRGSAVLKEFFGEYFDGTLVSDFFSAYNCLSVKRRQTCMAHLLREIKKVSARNESDEWCVFAKILKRLLRDALRLGARSDRDAKDYNSKRARIVKRLDKLCKGIYEDPDFARIVKRLIKYRDAIFCFLDDAQVPPDNNHAERELRPAVIARKNSFHNMSQRGARTQSILMSVYRTLRLRGHDPIDTIAEALAIHVAGGRLPKLPADNDSPTSADNDSPTPADTPHARAP